jgi:tetratricopeptide (TPR) repeat protein
MARKLTSRQLLVSMLALWRDLSHKEIGAAAGIPGKQVSLHLRRGELSDKDFEKLVSALRCPPAAVPIVTACLEALEDLEREVVLTAEERAEIEEAVLGAARRCREGLTEAALRSRAVPVEGYPQAHEIAPARRRAGELLARLKDAPEGERLALVRWADEYQGWALCERVCLTSVREASRNVERAAVWATLAQEIACRVRGPAQWRLRVEGFAAAHAANVLRVSGKLPAAETLFEQARRLWQSGSDPAGVLDPGRLSDLEASLRLGQRRLDEALALLEEAVAVGRNPERALINKGWALELLGEYERSLEILLSAVPLIQRQSDQQLENIVHCNLASVYCHLGRFAEAAELADKVRGVAVEMGDEVGVLRAMWIQGRIAAGLGRLGEARTLLTQARREFAARGMDYDVALALLEEAALLLEEGWGEKVRELALELATVFNSKKVHAEALAALGLFRRAAEREEATAELARRVLRYLFRARYDRGLRFEGS